MPGRGLRAARQAYEAAASVGRLLWVSTSTFSMFAISSSATPRACRARPHRVRLVVSRAGRGRDLGEAAGRRRRISGDCACRARRSIPRIRFCITRRRIERFTRRRSPRVPGFDDVLLYNERGEVTESTIANLVVEIGGALLTPPIACGLLPGTLRAHLLEEGKNSREGAHPSGRDAVPPRCYLVNSVRGFHPVSVAYRSVSLVSRLVSGVRRRSRFQA